MISHVRKRVLLVFIVLHCCAAWQREDSHGTAVDNQVNAPLEDVWPALAEPRTGDLDAILASGEIRVLTTFTLGSFFIDRGEQHGTVYRTSRELERYMRDKLGDAAQQLIVTIIPVRRDQLLPYLNAGYGDIAFANLTVTSQRSDLVDFSTSYHDQVQELLVTGPGITGIKSTDDLAGREVLVPRDSSYFESIAAINDNLRRRALPEIKITPTDPRLEVEDILEMLSAGLLPMTVVDDHRLRLWAQIFDNLTVHDDVVFRRHGKLAFAMRKNSPQLKALLDNFASENKVGSLFANMLVNRYINHTGWAKAALAHEPFRRFEQLAGLFQTYGEQYNFDWLLLASFAYQESGFDQNAHSSVGAIGVMQVMPATAADSNVGIENIHDLENNIHAGTKYLAFLRERYYSAAEIDMTERMLFTMAAYNAGPARINRLRNVAEEKGLDPNAWFNNVESIVAAHVGRETVDYVGNIYRYYIAYKRAVETQQSKLPVAPLQ